MTESNHNRSSFPPNSFVVTQREQQALSKYGETVGRYVDIESSSARNICQNAGRCGFKGIVSYGPAPELALSEEDALVSYGCLRPDCSSRLLPIQTAVTSQGALNELTVKMDVAEAARIAFEEYPLHYGVSKNSGSN